MTNLLVDGCIHKSFYGNKCLLKMVKRVYICKNDEALARNGIEGKYICEFSPNRTFCPLGVRLTSCRHRESATQCDNRPDKCEYAEKAKLKRFTLNDREKK